MVDGRWGLPVPPALLWGADETDCRGRGLVIALSSAPLVLLVGRRSSPQSPSLSLRASLRLSLSRSELNEASVDAKGGLLLLLPLMPLPLPLGSDVPAAARLAPDPPVGDAGSWSPLSAC